MFLWLSTASAGMSAASSAPAPARPLRAALRAVLTHCCSTRTARFSVLFDIDGTLFNNSDEVHLEVFAEMLAEPWLTHK